MRFLGFRRSISVVGAVVVFASVAIAGGGQQASATNWFGTTSQGFPSSCGSGNRADANPHYYYYEIAEQETIDATDFVMAAVIDPTAVNPLPAGSKTSATDVIIYAKHYVDYCNQAWATSGTSGGVAGLTTCNSVNASGRCGQHDVRYNLYVVEDLGQTFDRYLAAHENGHAIGLKHRDTETGAMMSGPGGSYQYTAHDKGHINGASWS